PLANSGVCKLILPLHRRGYPRRKATHTKGSTMTDFRQPTLPDRGYATGSSEVVRNRVMRNTYWLLALSLVPTVLGALVGLNTGINRVMGASPGTSAIVFLIGAFGLMYLIERNKNSSLG